MALETKLVQKLGQSLLMTPQLQQAIKLLQLGRLEYKEALEKELLENPVLEEVKESDDVGHTEVITIDDSDSSGGEESSNSEPKSDWEDYLESFTDHRGSAVPKGTFDFEDRPSLEATLATTESLADFVLGQIRLLDIPDTEKNIMFHICGNLDRDGFLCSSYEEIASECGCTLNEVQSAIEQFKLLEPAGVGAQNLQEALLFQLERRGKLDSLEGKLIKDHLDKLEKRRLDLIAKAEKVALDDVIKAVQFIQTLEPRPGRQFADESARYIVPDIYVYKIGKEYVITLNEDGLPRLRLSPYYLQVLQSGETSSGSGSSKAYLQERLKAASWLIKSIHQRQQTIYKVAESIVKFQREFLDHGIDKLKPLILKDVAESIGMHESTVSRVTTNKYVHTPQGVFELKYFFTTGIKTDEGDISSSSIKEKIRALIGNESSDNPVSDQKIVETLKAAGVDIARRTVAKYRESLGIPASSKRKKFF